MAHLSRFACFGVGLLLAANSQAAELLGRAVLPAQTFSPGPTSGQLIQTANGVPVPFQGMQPVQGFSAVLPGPVDGTYLVLSDNGFGSQANSPDALLRVYGIRPDFVAGTVAAADVRTGAPMASFGPGSYIQLRDPNRLVSKPIVADAASYPGSSVAVDPAITAGRLLTGADFDPESMRRLPDGTFVFGEEFGPFLVHTDASGVLLHPPTPLPNTLKLGSNPLVQSPQYPASTTGSLPALTAANLAASRGFEGMALNPGGTRLYAMLEGALTTDPTNSRLLINEFDVATRAYTGQVFSYRLENPAHAIGDLTAVSDTEFLVIERDNNQGAEAKFKRLYRISTGTVGADGFVSKTQLADFLDIKDPRNLGGNGTKNGVFTFPFQTIESVLPVGDALLVINDNNFPFSSGRTPGQADDNEFILIGLDTPLSVPEPSSALLLAGAASLLGLRRRVR